MDEAAALPSPRVLLSHRLQRYYGRLRRPPGTPPTARLITGYRARRSSSRSRRPPGRGGPPQFPSPPSERSEPHTPGGSSGLYLQALHPFHGLRPDDPGSAPPLARPKAGWLTTRQASLDATDRSVASPNGAFDAGLRPGPFPDRAASLLPGLLAATRTGLTPAGDDELLTRSQSLDDHLLITGRTGWSIIQPIPRTVDPSA